MPRARWLSLLLSAVLLPVLPTLVACGDDDDDATAGGTPEVTRPVGQGVQQPSTGGTEGGPEPALTMPVSRFALSQDDLGSGYITNLSRTREHSLRDYAKAAQVFPTVQEGERLLKEWGYVGGYETEYEPETRQRGVLNGAYYPAVEVHLFQTVDGARAAYAHFEKVLSEARAQRVSVKGLGNQSSGWKALGPPIEKSDILSSLHWFLWRRGNMVGIVKTWGAEPYMTIDIARNNAVYLDDKALGARTAVAPTPVPGAKTPAR